MAVTVIQSRIYGGQTIPEVDYVVRLIVSFDISCWAYGYKFTVIDGKCLRFGKIFIDSIDIGVDYNQINLFFVTATGEKKADKNGEDNAFHIGLF